MNHSLLNQIALTLIPGIGDKMIKSLIAHCQTPEAIFSEKKSNLQKIPGIGSNAVRLLHSANTLKRAEKEIEFLDSKNIEAHFFTDKEYPDRLKHCEDGPAIIYYKGNKNLNDQKFIAVVGTRKATHYGKTLTQRIIEDLKPLNATIVSGLAYGIDICAHKAALESNLSTIGVLAHGLDRIYPQIHSNVAEQMKSHGGLITEFISETNPDKENFPKRNRIIAGLCDAILVIEAAKTGGALITANIANSYNRDVFAIPGRIGDTFSEGCNTLIKTNRAALFQSVKDLEYIMGWENIKHNEIRCD